MRALALILMMGVLVMAGEIQARDVTVIAHRGASGLAPENTMAAFRKAIEVGSDGIELDVQLSSDGEVVVYHDLQLKPELTRLDGEWLTEKGAAISSLPLSELRRYDVGRVKPGTRYAGRYPDYAPADGERIPTLKEVLDLVKSDAPEGFALWIELKVNPEAPGLSSDPVALADAVVADVKEAGLEAASVLISFHWPALYRAQEIAPEIATGYISAERDWLNNIQRGRPGASPWTAPVDIDDHGSVPKAIAAAGGKYWSVYFRDLTPALAAEAKALGIGVGIWTLRDRGDIQTVLDTGTEYVTTDRPDWLVK